MVPLVLWCRYRWESDEKGHTLNRTSLAWCPPLLSTDLSPVPRLGRGRIWWVAGTDRCRYRFSVTSPHRTLSLDCCGPVHADGELGAGQHSECGLRRAGFRHPDYPLLPLVSHHPLLPSHPCHFICCTIAWSVSIPSPACAPFPLPVVNVCGRMSLNAGSDPPLPKGEP